MSSKDAVDFARKDLRKGRSLKSIADKLANIALRRYSEDNIAVIIIDLGGGKEGWGKQKSKWGIFGAWWPWCLSHLVSLTFLSEKTIDLERWFDNCIARRPLQFWNLEDWLAILGVILLCRDHPSPFARFKAMPSWHAWDNKELRQSDVSCVFYKWEIYTTLEPRLCQIETCILAFWYVSESRMLCDDQESLQTCIRLPARHGVHTQHAVSLTCYINLKAIHIGTLGESVSTYCWFNPIIHLDGA